MRQIVCRAHALRCLYAQKYTQDLDPTVLWDEFNEDEAPLSARETSFVRELLDGVNSHIEQVDLQIEAHAKGWSLERIPRVERNVLRIAIYELLYCADTPAGAIINEAVELAKLYGDEHSASYINGILGNIFRERTAAE